MFSGALFNILVEKAKKGIVLCPGVVGVASVLSVACVAARPRPPLCPCRARARSHRNRKDPGSTLGC